MRVQFVCYHRNPFCRTHLCRTLSSIPLYTLYICIIVYIDVYTYIYFYIYTHIYKPIWPTIIPKESVWTAKSPPITCRYVTPLSTQPRFEMFEAARTHGALDHYGNWKYTKWCTEWIPPQKNDIDLESQGLEEYPSSSTIFQLMIVILLEFALGFAVTRLWLERTAMSI